MNIRKDDTVLIISGKDRGKTGKVEKVLRQKNKVLVSGINIIKKHSKPSKKNSKGGIIDINAPIHISNVALVCSKCDKKTRIKHKILAGKKTRICSKCKEQI